MPEKRYLSSVSVVPVRQTISGDDYRELANGIRELARQTRLPVARRELIRLANSYDERGRYIDQRTYYW
jgi:hypothetical protein